MAFACLFPGQGSQSVGMLSGFPDPDNVVGRTLEEASEALGRDLVTLIRDGPEAELNRTENTQPAMLAVGVAVTRLWQHRGGAMPALVAGHSLGEYSALVAAGSLAFPEAIGLVADRARFMQEAVPDGEGKMAAILGLGKDKVQSICDETQGKGVVQPANINAPEQVVIAGHTDAVETVMEAAIRAGAKRTVELSVSIPSHCALMEPASQRLRERLAEVAIQASQVPLLTNVDAVPVQAAESLREALIRQVTRPVRWTQLVERLRCEGVDRALEMGPGKILCGLNRRIDGAMSCHSLQDATSLEKALADTS